MITANYRCHWPNAYLRNSDMRMVYLKDADLADADLRGADLVGATMPYSNLIGARFDEADLGGANLVGCDLRSASFQGANLRGARLPGANLTNADLRGADLTNADLKGANTDGVKANYLTSGYWPVPPMEGSFRAFKKVMSLIVTLQVPAHARRSSATTRKCRVSEALVVDIAGSTSPMGEAVSTYDPGFVYRIGEVVKSLDESGELHFDGDRWSECSTGIHCFMTREEAEAW